LLRTGWSGALKVKLGGQWQSAVPSTWRARTGVSVRVGQSRSERDAQSATLQQVMQWQATVMGAGKTGVLCDDTRVYNAALDWISSRQLRRPERYMIDPASPGARQAAASAAQQAQRAQLAAGAAAHADRMLDKYKTDVKAMTDTQKTLTEAAIKEAELTLSTLPIDEAQATGEGALQGFSGEAAQSGGMTHGAGGAQ
jgi:hypothetical protein